MYSGCDMADPPNPRSCPVKGVNTVLTCQDALTEGIMDGDATAANAPATAVLDFSWDNCQTSGASCTVNDITDVDVAIDEANAPSATIIPETAGTTITCAGWTCTWSWNPSTRPVTAEFDQDSQVATIADTVRVTGGFGCPLQSDRPVGGGVPDHG